MSTIASLLSLIDPTIRPYAQGAREVADTQRAQTLGQTNLLELADLKRKQAAEALVVERIKNDPELAQQLFGGGSVIGSLQTAPGGPPGGPGGMPAPGPITQGPLGAGGGPAQTIPAYPDASRFANVPPTGGGPIPPDVLAQTMPQVTPPPGTPTLATLGGQPQGPMQQPQNPLLEMARKDPRAALLLQQQMQARQDRQWKMQEQGLSNRIKIVDYLARMAQGATDQDSWTQFLEEANRVQPGAGGRLPQMYSREARDRVVAQGLDAKETMTLQVQDLQAQAAVIKARKEGRSTDVDNQLRAMGVQPGQETPGQMKEALQAVQEGKIAVSASQGTGQILPTATGFVRVNPRTNQPEQLQAPGGGPLLQKPSEAEQRAASFGDRAQQAHDITKSLEDKGLTPSIWQKVGEALPFGLGNYLQGDDRQQYRQAINQFGQALLRKESGAAISASEYEMTDKTYFPQPGDSKAVIAQKRQAREEIITSLQAESKQTGRTGTQAQPTSQAPAATGGQAGGKFLSEADIFTTMQKSGKSRDEVVTAAKAKGYTLR